MVEQARRPQGGRGRRGVFRRPRREEVPAAGPELGPWLDDDGDAGSAGVREPRRPKPLGPLADAGELPLPQPPLMVALPDARR